MFWRFGFASTSTLDTLLEKPNLTIEELLDEDELLQECKSQNSKLIDFLSQPRSVKRLCEHVVGTAQVSGPGGREWEEKVRFKYPYVASEVLSSDIVSIVETALANTEAVLDPFWNAVLHSSPGRVQPPQPHHSHPLLAGDPSATPVPPGKRGDNDDFAQPSQSSSSTSSSSSPPSPSPSPSSPQTVRAADNGPGKSVLAGYWAKVNGVFLDKKPLEMLAYIRQLPRIVERFVAHLETPAVVDLLYRIISSEQAQPSAGVIDWLSAQDLIAQIVELLSPCHSVDLHNTVSELIKAIIALSAPAPAGMDGGAGGLGGNGGGGPGGGQEQSFRVQNNLVRELAAEPIIRKMVSFMLDSEHSSQLTRRLSIAADEQQASAGGDNTRNRRKPSIGLRSTSGAAFSLSTLNEDAVFDDDDDDDDDDSNPQPLNPSMTPAFLLKSPTHRDSTSTVRPSDFFPDVRAPEVPVTQETRTSALITGIGIFIELIRKNNSDYFEQHLFHVLRAHLLQRQQEIAHKKMQQRHEAEAGAGAEGEGEAEGATPTTATTTTTTSSSSDEEDEEMEGMEEAMAELTGKLGLVHLGPMLAVLCERLPELQQFIHKPQRDEDQITTSLGKVHPLTFERYRITELYAELLHCSNMGLLNRSPGQGPQYSKDGSLQGGIQGLQVLARTLQGGDPDDGNEGDAAAAAAASAAAADDSPGNQDDDGEGRDGEDADASQASRSGPPAVRHQRQSSSLGDGDASFDSVVSSDGGEGGGQDAQPATTEADPETDPFADDASASASASIKSTLSSLSLADLVSPHPSGPPSPAADDDATSYVIGDLLKKKFLDCQVIPTILDLFFAYPWNNFLHNVVYDILQQCFNGRMDVGLNRKLTLAVFTQGKLPAKILEGHRQNNASMAGPRRIRLGFMGHANLIAEETVKLLERYPRDIADPVSAAPDAIPQPEWDTFVNESLRENREKESAPLAGGRPMTSAFGFGAGADADADESDEDGGRLGGVGLGGGGENETFASYLSSQMTSAHGDDDDDDDDDSDEEAQWLAADRTVTASHGFDDVFEPSGAGVAASGTSAASRGGMTAGVVDDADDDDGWGEFASAGGGDSVSSSSASSAAAQYDDAVLSRPNLTPADWAASGFRHHNSSSDAWAGGGGEGQGEDAADAHPRADADDAFESEFDPTQSSAPSANADLADLASSSPTSASSSDDQTPFVDLSDAASYRAAQAAAFGAGSARRLSNPSSSERPFAPQPVPEATPSRARSGSGAGGEGRTAANTTSDVGSTDPSAAQATYDQEPLGPGVSADAEVKDGMIQRSLDDGSVVSVPLDDVALAQSAGGGGGAAAAAAAAEEKQDETAAADATSDAPAAAATAENA